MKHHVEKLYVEIEIRQGLVLGWCLFLAKFQAAGAYSGGAYKKKRVKENTKNLGSRR